MEASQLETRFKVEGMDCEDEVRAVRSSLRDLAGIHEIDANLMTSQIRIVHAPEASAESIKGRIESAGLIVLSSEKSVQELKVSKRAVVVLISGILLVTGLFLSWFSILSGAALRAFYLASILTGITLIAPKAWRSLKLRSLDMNVLMTVATLGAIGIEEYSEAAAVVFLFALAEWLESFSLERARRSVQALLKLVPDHALLLLSSGEVTEKTVSEVSVGSILRVRSGERIPLDGVVMLGSSTVNQAPITGESIPVSKKKGDLVLAGTVNGEGSLDIQVTKGHEETKIAEIISLLENAQKQKAPTQRFVDVFAKYYTPAVFILSLVVLVVPPLFFGGDWSAWIYRALVLLVIACPCALVIATPVSIVSGLTAMMKKGILIKGGAGLETLGKLQALAVDKTGTITEGSPRVLGVYPLGKFSAEEILRFAASIDQHSTHPLAIAVVSEAKRRNIKSETSIEYRAISGRGAEALIGDHFYFVGNHRFAHETAVCTDELEGLLKSLEDQAQSVVVVGHRPHSGCPGEVMGVLGLGDAVRADASEMIGSLKNAGIKSVIMLSGDNQRTVDAISEKVGIDEAYGDLLPEDKVIRIKEIKDRFRFVAMVGDGVNDAPAMATASLGIAMGGSGTDTAIETSDITLMQDRLVGIADAILMGRRTIRVVWFNTGFALATKLLFLGLSMAGYSSLWLAIAADTGATLFVIANSLRLLR